MWSIFLNTASPKHVNGRHQRKAGVKRQQEKELLETNYLYQLYALKICRTNRERGRKACKSTAEEIRKRGDRVLFVGKKDRCPEWVNSNNLLKTLNKEVILHQKANI